MKIYTSYFAKQKDLEERGITCIGICAIPPKWFNGPNFVCIAPTKDILFEYNGSNPNVYQTLTLVKKGASNNLNNKYTESHFVEQ